MQEQPPWPLHGQNISQQPGYITRSVDSADIKERVQVEYGEEKQNNVIQAQAKIAKKSQRVDRLKSKNSSVWQCPGLDLQGLSLVVVAFLSHPQWI